MIDPQILSFTGGLVVASIFWIVSATFFFSLTLWSFGSWLTDDVDKRVSDAIRFIRVGNTEKAVETLQTLQEQES